MAHPSWSATRGSAVSVRQLMLRFTAAGVVATLLLAAVIAVLARQAGTREAIDSARQITWVSATGIAEPLLTDGLVRGDPVAVAAFHDAMSRVVLQGSLVRVKLWTPQGRVVYASESRLIGAVFQLDDEELTALAEGRMASGVSDLTKPENRYERSFGKLLEVYVGVRTVTGAPLLFEAYFDYAAVARTGQQQWRQYAPPVLGGLVLLQLVQIPAAWSLATRLRRHQEAAERLLRNAVDSSDLERRRIAADLHDGLVQELVGVTYALDAARLGTPDSDRDRSVIAAAASRLRGSVAQLRSQLVEIYPPDLAAVGLSAALQELTADLHAAGVTVVVELDRTVDDLAPDLTRLLFRAAQECLRNVARHSGATQVRVSVRSASGTVRLVVEDDGAGFDGADLARRAEEGHVGLRSLTDLVADAGGRVVVSSAPGRGTCVELVLPDSLEEM